MNSHLATSPASEDLLEWLEAFSSIVTDDKEYESLNTYYAELSGMAQHLVSSVLPAIKADIRRTNAAANGRRVPSVLRAPTTLEQALQE